MSLAALAVGLPGSSCCLAWSLAPQPVEGVLVLRNGNVLRGKIQQQDGLFHVHLAHGELQVREKSVEMVCQNLEEAYQRRREARAGSTADSHLELASWCVRHNLFQHAEAELAAVQEIDPQHPRLALQQRQLKHSLQIMEREKQLQEAQAVEPVRQAPLPPEALEKAPQWARALFVRQIQPLIVHSCAAGGCHQAGDESSFQVNRLAIDGAGHPDATLRNLAATLQQVDWQTAEESDLLQRAKAAHGPNSKSNPLAPHKLKVLESWVEQLVEAERKANEIQSLPLVAELPTTPTLPELELKPPQRFSEQQADAIRVASYQPVDPFDPARFNRQHSEVVEHSPASSVPHVLAPQESELIQLPVAE